MDGPDMTEYHRLSKSFMEMWKREELKDKDFITEGYRAHSEIIEWTEGELSDINKENAELKEKLLVATEALEHIDKKRDDPREQSCICLYDIARFALKKLKEKNDEII